MDARADPERRSREIYQAYGLDGRYTNELDLDELRERFREKYGRNPKKVFVTAGGGTALAGPIEKEA